MKNGKPRVLCTGTTAPRLGQEISGTGDVQVEYVYSTSRFYPSVKYIGNDFIADKDQKPKWLCNGKLKRRKY